MDQPTYLELHITGTEQNVMQAANAAARVINQDSPSEYFENRVKKFAEPALDQCTEHADFVWAAYLDKAMLDIYYAQKDKVAEIKQGCFDFVSGFRILKS